MQTKLYQNHENLNSKLKLTIFFCIKLKGRKIPSIKKSDIFTPFKKQDYTPLTMPGLIVENNHKFLNCDISIFQDFLTINYYVRHLEKKKLWVVLH